MTIDDAIDEAVKAIMHNVNSCPLVGSGYDVGVSRRFLERLRDRIAAQLDEAAFQEKDQTP